MTRYSGAVTRWIPVLMWAGAIFAVSSVPGSNLPGGYSAPAHFAEYAVLAILLFRALRPDRSLCSALLIAAFAASLYGITDELHQAFVPMRTPDPMDWAMDTAGAICGLAVAAATTKVLAAHRRRSQ